MRADVKYLIQPIYEDFKEKLKDTNLPLYDTIEGDKINKTDQFLENIWKSLPKKK